MSTKTASIKNIIFDLGGVILDLSAKDTLNAFARLSGLDVQTVHDQFISAPEFLQYEKGTIDDSQFRQFVRSLYNIQAGDEAIDQCWNAMLLGLPLQKLKLLLKLKAKYTTFLLSNTNNIHLNYINNNILVRVTKERNLDNYFHRSYYSHHLNMRKPDAEIFQHVLNENHLLPHETLFLDDNVDNVAGAERLGIQTVHVTTTDFILDYFDE